MDRRVFIGSLALATLAMPQAVFAEPVRKIYRIGILGSRTPTPGLVGPQPQDPAVNPLLRGLRDLGYVYGEHFVTEPRSAEGKLERFPKLSAELVRLEVDVIVAAGPTLPALKQATSTIPVVMIGASDPVGQGFAQSLGRPGGNFTGLSLQLTETTGKRLELLKELSRVRHLWPSSGIRGQARGPGRWPNPPLDSGVGNYFRSRFETRARSGEHSRRRPARASALCS
jgi:putative ABC transport system substrate-binding protein